MLLVFLTIQYIERIIKGTRKKESRTVLPCARAHIAARKTNAYCFAVLQSKAQNAIVPEQKPV